MSELKEKIREKALSKGKRVPISLDLRQKALDMVANGVPKKDVYTQLGITNYCLQRILNMGELTKSEKRKLKEMQNADAESESDEESDSESDAESEELPADVAKQITKLASFSRDELTEIIIKAILDGKINIE